MAEEVTYPNDYPMWEVYSTLSDEELEALIAQCHEESAQLMEWPEVGDRIVPAKLKPDWRDKRDSESTRMSI